MGFWRLVMVVAARGFTGGFEAPAPAEKTSVAAAACVLAVKQTLYSLVQYAIPYDRLYYTRLY